MRALLLAFVLFLAGCADPSPPGQDPFACEFLKFPPSKELIIPDYTRVVLVFMPLDKIREKKGPNALAVTFYFENKIIVWLPAGQVSRELMCAAWHEAEHAVKGSWHP